MWNLRKTFLQCWWYSIVAYRARSGVVATYLKVRLYSDENSIKVKNQNVVSWSNKWHHIMKISSFTVSFISSNTIFIFHWNFVSIFFLITNLLPFIAFGNCCTRHEKKECPYPALQLLERSFYLWAVVTVTLPSLSPLALIHKICRQIEKISVEGTLQIE